MNTKFTRQMLLLVAMLALAVLFGIGAHSALAATEGTVTFDLLTDIADGVTPLQDLFVERNDLPSDMVIRIRPDEAKDPSNLSKMLYAAGEEAPEDIFQLTDHPLGPFKKGKALGFTLGQWLAATGKATYTVKGDEATLDATFQNLVPNAVYTMWCVRVVPPPDPNPHEIESLPCGAPDGSQNTFHSDANGSATFHIAMKPMEETTDKILTVIGIAYHSDGKTCGVSHCALGEVSHVQLSNIVPPIQSATLPAAGAPTQTMIGVWFGVVIGLLLLAGGWLLANKAKRV